MARTEPGLAGTGHDTLRPVKNLSAALVGRIPAVLGIPSAMANGAPRYEVILSDGNMELRRYAPMLIAKTEVAGELDEASNGASD